MTELTFNILFYLLGLALASIPLLILKKSELKTKPLWYKILIPVIVLFLIVMGVIKTANDYSTEDNRNKRFNKLTSNVSNLKITIDSQKRTYNLLIRKLDSAGVLLKNGQIIITKTTKNFNNKIDKLNTLNQY